MRKYKNLLAAALVAGLFAASAYSVFAATTSDMSDVVGGWDEDTGYFINAEAYIKAMEGNSLSRASDPVHKGKREEKSISGTTHSRAHGWTTWKGKYHYTRARMETSKGTVLQDSERVWGMDSTEAISPWNKFDPDQSDKARTYYGSEE